MSYKTYDEYKESKMFWIDKIPSTWDTIKAKHCFNLSGGYAFKSDDFTEEGIPLVRIGDITNGTIDFNNCKRLPLEYATMMKEFLVESGDILIALTGATIGKIGQVPKTNEKILLNQRVGKLSSDSSNYYKYILSSDLIKKQINLIADGSAQENISNEDIGNFEIFDIDNGLKQQIANYLDKKTAKIDATIAKNEELIELLEEKRVALINQVVTKGLDSDVPMKDSGVEWIGEIPENWDVVLFKRLFNLIKDGTHGSFERVDDGEPLLSAKNIFNDKINISKTESCISKDNFLSIVSNGFPKKDDLLMTIVGTIGRSCVYDKEFPLAFQRSVSFIRLTYDNPYYYNYFIKSQIFQSQLLVKAKQSAQKGVYLNDIKECLVIRPPYEIQIEIAKYLQNRITKINETTSKIQDNINLLEEYKTSLIHHVVTGKIDVRGEEI
ncbi:MAG: restriction endonuclease subunit S [Methanobrevibacter sp.]|nr:restriction endonuclease subunit S [Methanobrevibacter sp.]